MNIDNCQKITQNVFSLGENNYPTLNSPESMREFFDREGYIVVRNAVAKELCAEAIQAFNLQVKPDTKTFFMRHESGTGECHVFTEAGFMKYPIMNIQDLGSRYQQFRETGLGILTQDTVKKVITTILGEPGKLIHTMYFDGNQHTWPHRDTYTIDSEQIGTMIGVWVAAEDIQLGAGSFYVYPKSHRMVMPLEATGEEINPNGKDYKDGVRKYLDMNDLVCTAPALCQGDMILWSSKTIHGSLDTTAPHYSRRSFTGHYISESQEFLWFHKYRGSRKTMTVNGVKVTLHGDKTGFGKQLMYRLIIRFPKEAQVLRNINKKAKLIVHGLKTSLSPMNKKL